MKITVIIPTFNRAHTIQRAINSVFSQTYTPDELIIVDDGSTDQTPKILQQLISYSSFSIKLMSLKNSGVSAARNTAISTAQGEWITLLDSDDEWLPQKLESQVQALRQNPQYRWCHTDEIWIRNGVRVNLMKKHQKPEGDVFVPSLSLCCISPSSVMIHRSMFEQYGYFNTSYPVCEDYDLWLRFALDESLLFVKKNLLIKYGGHSDQLSRSEVAMDKWRVKTIHSLLEKIKNSEKKQKALDVLQKKLRILKKGALKHGSHLQLQNFLGEELYYFFE